MEPGSYRDSCGQSASFYGPDDPGDDLENRQHQTIHQQQQQQQHHQQQQQLQQQHLAPYPHQLAYHPSLLAAATNHPNHPHPEYGSAEFRESLRGRNAYLPAAPGHGAPALAPAPGPGPSILRSLFGVAGHTHPSPNVLVQASCHPRPSFQGPEQQEPQPATPPIQPLRVRHTASLSTNSTTPLHGSTTSSVLTSVATPSTTAIILSAAPNATSPTITSPIAVAAGSVTQSGQTGSQDSAPTSTKQMSTPVPGPILNKQDSPNPSPSKPTPVQRPVLTERQLPAFTRPKRLTVPVKPLRAPLPCRELPPYLEYKYTPGDEENISGVVAREEVEKGAEFGPYEGTLLDEEQGACLPTTWELCLRGKIFFYIDGRRKEEQNWMTHMVCARSKEEQNVEAFQYYGEIYFRTTKALQEDSELKVFYSEEYARRVGTKLKLDDLKTSEDSGDVQCDVCQRQYQSSKLMSRHVRLEHDPTSLQEMLPVISWKARSHKTQGRVRDSRVTERKDGQINPERDNKGQNVLEKHESQGDSENYDDHIKKGGTAVVKVKHLRLQEECILPEQLEKVVVEKTSFVNDLAKATARKGKNPSRHFVCKSEVFNCTECGKSFPTEGRLQAHELFHDYSEKHGCPICGEKQRNAVMLVKHLSHHDERRHKCSVCEKSYKARYALYRHERNAHGARMHTKNSKILMEEKTKAGSVQKPERKGKEKSRRHYRIVSRIPLEPYGDQQMSTVGTANVNAKDNSGGVSKDKGKEQHDMLGRAPDYYAKARPFKCRHCAKMYGTRRRLFEHEKEIHEGNCQFKCTSCPRTFVNRQRYAEHLKAHNHLYHCAQCPRTFASESALRNHQGEHTGEKPCKCDICGKGFRTPKNLSSHRRRQHTERPKRFQCSICPKAFTENNGLVRHERRHKGIRPFVCLTCGKGFTAKSVLVSHIECLHSEKRPFSCKFCGKSFALNQNYTYHMLKHKVDGNDVIWENRTEPNDAQMIESQP